MQSDNHQGTVVIIPKTRTISFLVSCIRDRNWPEHLVMPILKDETRLLPNDFKSEVWPGFLDLVKKDL